ncbi:hypothetical protein AB3S75_031052 [Citrus x aurantiifolia]
MSLRCRRLSSRVSCVFLALCMFLNSLPGLVLAAVVTLDSIKIHKTHEWLDNKPTVYFKCQGENKKILPDVKEKNTTYVFKGEESWQPLTEFLGTKCKRCGLYEEDTFNSDDVFDEWEFCPGDFADNDGKYIRKTKKEFDATFLCPKCKSGRTESDTHVGRKGMHVAIIVLISLLASIVTAIVLVAAYKYWQKKKRQQDQARFLKLFEDGDEIEDELGLGTVI